MSNIINQGKNIKYNKRLLSYNDDEIVFYQTNQQVCKIITDLSFLDDSFVIIFNLFDKDNYKDFNTLEFVKSIIDNFYNSIIKTELNNLYTFYIFIKEICTIENIDIHIIISLLKLINMDCHFVDILNNFNKLEYIKIILKEFIKIIDKVKTFL